MLPTSFTLRTEAGVVAIRGRMIDSLIVAHHEEEVVIVYTMIVMCQSVSPDYFKEAFLL